MQEMVTLTIDGQTVEVPAGTTILEAAKKLNIKIPSLCYSGELNHKPGGCRVCLVEIEGNRNLQASCVYPVSQGMKVITNSEKVRKARKVVVELLLSDHPWDCLTCYRNLNCELQKLANELHIREVRFTGEKAEHPTDATSHSIVREQDKCIKCGRCVTVCNRIQTVGALGFVERGFETIVTPAFNRELTETCCILCGQCTLVCPVAALREKDGTQQVWNALSDPTKHVVVQVAPAIRATIGEEFGMEPGTVVTGKVFAALRRLGFDAVCDTAFAADLTIMEEGSELLQRLAHGGKLPLITSCSPGWVKFMEHFYSELLDNLSTCKSPQQMFGAIAKSYYAEKMGINPKDIFVVSIMPCSAKKFEAAREEMFNEYGMPDVDVVLTTRELARMIKEAGIEFVSLPDEEPDELIGQGTGAGVVFGATGGVMEAALRTAYELSTGKTLPKVEFEAVRGMEEVKTAEVLLGDRKLKVAVAHGLGNARKLMDQVKNGQVDYDFIEIMACPGGCIGGGGQPHGTDMARRKARAAAIYKEDTGKQLRKSHENPSVKKLYEEYLGSPLGEKSHHLLHTHYVKRSKYPVPETYKCAK